MHEIYSMLSARGCQVDSNSNDCIGIVQQYIITVELATHWRIVGHIFSQNWLPW